MLGKLSQAAPVAAQQRRFALLALVMGASSGIKDGPTLTPDHARQMEQLVPAILAHPEEVTADRQELSYALPPLIAALPDAGARAQLGGALIAALNRVYADGALPIPDRLGTLSADIALSKGAGERVAPAVLAKVRQRVAWADGAAKDTIVRQSVISNAAELLDEAGDRSGARRLLTRELKRSASPYYYMLDLANLAEEDKDPAGAIAWARKGYESAHGPATRVQWAIFYSSAVLRLKPRDTAAVEAGADAVVAELARNPDDYYQRTRVKAAKWGQELQAWSRSTGNAAALARVAAKMEAVCARQGAAAADCRAWARPA
jgi:protein disulfide-isomerase